MAKHFPGHGYASADSHVAAPRDERPFAQIQKKDLLPYKAVIEAGVAAVMPAHVVYPQVDAEPAGYSKHWLQEVLRGQLRFDGLIFSDDLSMEGAAVAGGPPERAKAALAAGCDMVLLCNNPKGLDELLDSLEDVSLAEAGAAGPDAEAGRPRPAEERRLPGSAGDAAAVWLRRAPCTCLRWCRP